MKKTIILLGICSVIMACNSRNTTTSTEDTTSISQDTVTQTGIDTTTITTTQPAPAEGTTTTPPAASAPTTTPPAEKKTAASTAKGEQLISKSDCLACHKLNEKLVGPAYSAVATKYDDTEANLNYLAGKIISGGSGVWGDVPMTPHPAISKDDAKEMARYVLSLK